MLFKCEVCQLISLIIQFLSPPPKKKKKISCKYATGWNDYVRDLNPNFWNCFWNTYLNVANKTNVLFEFDFQMFIFLLIM